MEDVRDERRTNNIVIARKTCENPSDKNNDILELIKKAFEYERETPFKSNSIGIFSFNEAHNLEIIAMLKKQFPNLNVFVFSLTDYHVYSSWGQGLQDPGIFKE